MTEDSLVASFMRARMLVGIHRPEGAAMSVVVILRIPGNPADLESYAAGRTAAAISKFIEQIPRRARVLREGREEDVDAASLVPGALHGAAHP